MSLLRTCIYILLCTTSSFSGKAQNEALIQVYHFGNGIDNNTGITVNRAVAYDEHVGFGFDFHSSANAVFHKASVSGSGSLYFSIKLPEGNYKINVTLGGHEPSETTVKAESRRLMLKNLQVAKNESVQHSFVVNVRTPKINDQLNINIKDREINYLNWDDKLTLEFSGHPAVRTISVTKLSDIRTIYLAGDSTVTDQDLEPWASWGQFMTLYLDDHVVVANYAASGASLSSFSSRHRLEKILSLMHPGDYLFIEFGHNDQKRKGDGIGPWLSYTKLLEEFVVKARSKGGIPVFVTPTQRRAFNSDGTVKPTHGDYPDAMRIVSQQLQVPLIDITKMTTDMYEAWGAERARKAFVQYPANSFPGQTVALEDNTHFNGFGANEIAKCILQGIRNSGLDISKNIKPDTPVYDPKKPDNYGNWDLPISPRFENKKPEGN